MQYALIKNGIVENVIEASEEFASQISSKYDSVVRVDELTEKPSIDDKYKDDKFESKPKKEKPKKNDRDKRIEDQKERILEMDLEQVKLYLVDLADLLLESKK